MSCQVEGAQGKGMASIVLSSVLPPKSRPPAKEADWVCMWLATSFKVTVAGFEGSLVVGDQRGMC